MSNQTNETQAEMSVKTIIDLHEKSGITQTVLESRKETLFIAVIDSNGNFASAIGGETTKIKVAQLIGSFILK